jgi:hypothetical protein
MIVVSLGCERNSLNNEEFLCSNSSMVFQTDFESTILILGDYDKEIFASTDSFSSEYINWDQFIAHENIGTVEISYEAGSDSDRKAMIEDDPELMDNKVLLFQIIEPHINEGFRKKGRVQLNVNDNNCITEIYQTVRLRLHPDMACLKNWDERVTWLSLFEFWNNADWTSEDHPFRVTVNLYKDEKGPADAMHFHVKGDFKNECKYCKWNLLWENLGDSFSVPFGEWMEVELYIKEGDDDSGRFFMAVTPDSGEKMVVFDLICSTIHPNETNPDGFAHIQPLKLYTSGDLINYMKDSVKELSVCWDDWYFSINSGFY